MPLSAFLLLLHKLLHVLRSVIEQVPLGDWLSIPSISIQRTWVHCLLGWGETAWTSIMARKLRGNCGGLAMHHQGRILNQERLLRWSSGCRVRTGIYLAFQLVWQAGQFTMRTCHCVICRSHSNQALLKLGEYELLSRKWNARLRVDVVLKLVLEFHVLNFCLFDLFRAFLLRRGHVWLSRIIYSSHGRLIVRRDVVVLRSNLVYIQAHLRLS